MIQQLQAGSRGQQLLAAVQSVHADVRVSGRYGTWNPTQLTVEHGAGAGLPAFVRLQGGGTTSPAANAP